MTHASGMYRFAYRKKNLTPIWRLRWHSQSWNDGVCTSTTGGDLLRGDSMAVSQRLACVGRLTVGERSTRQWRPVGHCFLHRAVRVRLSGSFDRDIFMRTVMRMFCIFLYRLCVWAYLTGLLVFWQASVHTRHAGGSHGCVVTLPSCGF